MAVGARSEAGLPLVVIEKEQMFERIAVLLVMKLGMVLHGIVLGIVPAKKHEQRSCVVVTLEA